MSIFAGIPSVATSSLSVARFIAESLTEVTTCTPARGSKTPAESRDRISSSATRRKQNPLEHPAGSSEGCSLKTTHLEVDSPAALAFSKAEGVVRVVSIVSRRSCLRFLSSWGSSIVFCPGFVGFPLEIRSMRLTTFNKLIEPPLPACTCGVRRPVFFFICERGGASSRFPAEPWIVEFSWVLRERAHGGKVPRPHLWADLSTAVGI